MSPHTCFPIFGQCTLFSFFVMEGSSFQILSAGSAVCSESEEKKKGFQQTG